MLYLSYSAKLILCRDAPIILVTQVSNNYVNRTTTVAIIESALDFRSISRRRYLVKLFFWQLQRCVTQQVIFPSIDALQIHCALLEWRTGKLVQVRFESGRFEPIYKKLLKLLEKVEADDVHSAKLLEVRRGIAERGR